MHGDGLSFVSNPDARGPIFNLVGASSVATVLLGVRLHRPARRTAWHLFAAGLVAFVLDFSKIEAGKMRLELTDFDVHTVLEDVVGLLAQPARDKGLGLASHTATDVPALVTGDPGRLRQVLVNLVGNAAKFTESGRVEVRVRPDRTEGPGGATSCASRSPTPASASAPRSGACSSSPSPRWIPPRPAGTAGPG